MKIMVTSFFRKVLGIAASDIDICGNIQDVAGGKFLRCFRALLLNICEKTRNSEEMIDMLRLDHPTSTDI